MLDKNIQAQAIVKKINTWKYKREQPSDVEKLTAFTRTAVENSSPLRFLMYWGKGDRKEVGQPEKEAFAFLGEFFSRIKKVYHFGSTLDLVFTDTHARLNGYPEDEINSYFTSVKSLSEKTGYRVTNLSNLASFNEKDLIGQIETLCIGSELLAILVASSAKHYKVSERYDYAAKIYYLQNQLEKKALEVAFPESIFLTFNGSKFNALFPTNLPIFYMYSSKKGKSVKPWFDDVARA